MRPSAALPLLLPVEFSLMTTMSRGFITGLVPLALLPWVMDLRNATLRSLLTGAIISIAWYINPNSVIFTVGYACWYILSQRPRPKHALLLLIGLAPGTIAHCISQLWCTAHVDRIIHRLRPEQLAFDPSRMLDGLSRLDAHFQWLMPLVWPVGSLVGAVLIALLVLAVRRRMWPLVIGLAAPVVVILLSLGMEKTHEGWDSVFFPLSRMFLALPLLLFWALTLFIGEKRSSVGPIIVVLLLAIVAVAWKVSIMERTTLVQVKSQRQWVDVRPIAQLRQDAYRLRRISDRYGVELILPFSGNLWPQFRAFLHPVLEPRLPPTYLVGYERRYWQRDRFSKAVVPVVLFVGGRSERWSTIMAADRRFLVDHAPGEDDVYVLVGNTLPTDSIANWLEGQLGFY